MTDDEWRALCENFKIGWLLDAIDEVDALRGRLSDDECHWPPEIRDSLLKLHQFAMEVVNGGSRSRVQEFFDLAIEVKDQIFDMMEFLTKLQGTFARLTCGPRICPMPGNWRA
ncbi:MAG TPA: transposase [Stellaceae bacterium]|nr:transposase [Stellaceae bacterium]